MRIPHGSLLVLAAVSLFLTLATATRRASAQSSEAKVYVCPPCGRVCDDQTFDKPGQCPTCGMALIEKGSAPPPAPAPPAEARKNVAVFIFNGVQIVDYAAPYEVFGQARTNVFTVAEKPDAITTAMGTKVIPSYTFADCPHVDVLVTPGGGGSHAGDGAVGDQMNNPKAIAWIQQKAAESSLVLSVCNGAFLLAKAGLLDGLEATTFYGLIDDLRTAAPKTKIVRNRRFVDNGKIITSAGLTSGIDASLHVVERLFGRDRALSTALHMEYNWDPDGRFARADFADQYLPNVDLPPGWQGSVVTSLGGPDKWDLKYRIQARASLAEVARVTASQIAEHSKWKRSDKGGADQAESRWSFTDDRHRRWTATVKLKAAPGEADTYLGETTLSH